MSRRRWHNGTRVVGSLCLASKLEKVVTNTFTLNRVRQDFNNADTGGFDAGRLEYSDNVGSAGPYGFDLAEFSKWENQEKNRIESGGTHTVKFSSDMYVPYLIFKADGSSHVAYRVAVYSTAVVTDKATNESVTHVRRVFLSEVMTKEDAFYTNQIIKKKQPRPGLPAEVIPDEPAED